MKIFKGFLRVTISFLFLSILFLSYALYGQEQLIFAVTLIRHGDRTPTHDIKSDPYKWEIGKGELTALGMNQQNSLGSQLRKRYVNEFRLISPNFLNNEVFVRCTDFNRTIQSAQSFLSGLYPLGLGPIMRNGDPALPAAYQPIPLRTLPVPMDNLLLAHDAQIDKFNEMCDKLVYPSETWKAQNAKYSPKFKEWSEIFGEKINSLKDISSIGDNLNVRSRNGVSYPKGLSEEDAKTLIYLADWIQAQQFKPKAIGNYFGHDFLQKLQEDMQDSIEGKNRFKYILYSGHDSSILPVMSALGVPLELNPPYASHIDFELYSDENAAFVKIFFNFQPIILPGEKYKKCDFQNFRKIIAASIPR